MINYEAAEPLLLALLAPLQDDGVIVRGMPDSPQQKGVTATDAPLAVLWWFGATPLGAGSSDGIYQATTNRIVVEVRTPTLRGTTGQYQLPGRIQRLLQGQRVQGLGRLDFAGWQMLERGDGPNDRGYKGLLSFNVISLAQGGG